MSDKTKNLETVTDQLNKVALNAGVMLMSGLMAFGFLEVPHEDKRAVIPPANTLAPAVEEHAGGGHNPNDMRREREETGPHYTSYGATQRTPARAGRV